MGVSILQPETTVTLARLKAFIQEALLKLGLPESDAAVVAGLMAEADLQGSEGHGVTRLPQYARRIKAGGFNVRPNIHVVREQAGMALLNGDNGMGHLVMKRAAQIAIEKARRDRKSTRLNSSHTVISYAVFCLKKKKNNTHNTSIQHVSRFNT